MASRYRLLLLIVLAAVCGGSIPPFAKVALEALGPFTLVTLRFASAMLILLPFVLYSRQLHRGSLRQLWLPAVIGALNPILVFIGLKYTRASLSVLLYAAIPALIALYYAWRGRPASRRQVTGIAIGFLGVAIIALLPLIEQGSLRWSEMWGNLLTLGAVLAFFVYGLLSKRLQDREHVSPAVLTLAFTVASLLISLPFTLAELAGPQHLAPVGLKHMLAVAEVGIVGTALGYLAYLMALQAGSELTASLMTYLQPVSTIILAVVLLSEPITWTLAVGGTLALIGAQLALGVRAGLVRLDFSFITKYKFWLK